MFRKFFGLVFILIILAVVFKDQVIKTAITVGTTQVTGAPVKIQDFSFSVLKQKVSIEGFQVFQPRGFEKGILIDIPEVTVSYNLPDLLKGRVYLPAVIVDLKEMVVIKDKDGNLNVDALKVAQKKDKTAVKKDVPKSDKKLPLQIDILTLTVGKVIVKDYSQGAEPVVQVFEAGIKDRVFKNITSPDQLAALIMVTAMGPTSIKGAAIYGAASVLGVAILPVGVAGLLLADDDVVQEFPVSLEQAFRVSLRVAERRGEVSSQDQARGIIKAKVDGAQVAIELTAAPGNKTRIKVSARKYFLPKPDIAGGVLYQIENNF